jgi:hypothetical protein
VWRRASRAVQPLKPVRWWRWFGVLDKPHSDGAETPGSQDLTGRAGWCWRCCLVLALVLGVGEVEMLTALGL